MRHWIPSTLCFLCLFALALAVAPQTVRAEEEPVVEKDAPKPAPAERKAKNDKPTIELLDAGAEPRALYRYKFAEGKRDKIEMRMAMETDAAAATGMKLPVFLANIEASWADVQGSELADLRMKFVKFEAEPDPENPMAELMGAVGELMKGLTMITRIDGQGEVQSMRMEGAEAIEAMGAGAGDLTGMANSPGQQQPALPKEKIGLGARWKVVSYVDAAQGFKQKVTVKYKLAAIDGNKLTIEGELVQEMSGEAEASEQGPVTMQITSMKGKGTMKQVIDLTRPAPLSLTLKMTSEMTQEINMGGEAQAMDINMTMNITAKGTPMQDAAPVVTKASGPSDD